MKEKVKAVVIIQKKDIPFVFRLLGLKNLAAGTNS
jgi:hypothetical protein